MTRIYRYRWSISHSNQTRKRIAAYIGDLDMRSSHDQSADSWWGSFTGVLDCNDSMLVLVPGLNSSQLPTSYHFFLFSRHWKTTIGSHINRPLPADRTSSTLSTSLSMDSSTYHIWDDLCLSTASRDGRLPFWFARFPPIYSRSRDTESSSLLDA